MLPRRRPLRRLLPRILLFFFLAWNFLDVLYVRRALSISAHSHLDDTLSSPQRIFVASTHWNNEAVIRDYWTDAVLGLVRHFGSENIYISVYESGSWDDSKGALRVLDGHLEDLGTPRTIVLDETTHLDEISKSPTPSGWIDTPRGQKELRRIPYLSSLRNLSLKPLEDLAEKGHYFDKLLFLNDVVFTMCRKTQDVVNLLNTNGGSYSAACAIDFSNPPKYYDTFALRDSDGQQPIMQVWPYFKSQRSRSAIKANAPVPVESCWNGMVFMDAAPFYARSSRPAAPLRFHGISDSLATYHLEGSECCLIHADNPLTSSKGVWLNPDVRVGYSGQAYEATHPNDTVWLSWRDIFIGLWKNRLSRWSPINWMRWWAVNWTVDRRLRAWGRDHTDSKEPGRHCLINEMQVLVYNGWAHV